MRPLGDIFPPVQNLSGRWVIEPQDRHSRRGFPAPALSGQAQDFPPPNAKGHPIHGLYISGFPFAEKAAAMSFQGEQGGTMMLYGEITPDIMKTLGMGGMKMGPGSKHMKM